MKILIICIVWLAVVFGSAYFVTGFENDKLDELFGEIAGLGLIVILIGSYFLRKKKGKA
jgi:hypothetical protein